MDPQIQNKYHIVSIPTPTFRGRKKLPGRLIYDPAARRLNIFLCYCGHCNSKVLADKETVEFLTKNLYKSNRRLSARIFRRVARKLN